MTDTTPVVNHPCDTCGQLDSDPMFHISDEWQKDERTTITDPSFHYDCLPEVYEHLLEGPQHAVSRAAIEAAREGLHGDALREFIDAQPTDNDVIPEDDADTDTTPEG